MIEWGLPGSDVRGPGGARPSPRRNERAEPTLPLASGKAQRWCIAQGANVQQVAAAAAKGRVKAGVLGRGLDVGTRRPRSATAPPRRGDAPDTSSPLLDQNRDQLHNPPPWVTHVPDNTPTSKEPMPVNNNTHDNDPAVGREMLQTLFAEYRDAKKADGLPRQKQAKLGRYERVSQLLESDRSDVRKVFIDINDITKPMESYAVLDLFAGAGGMTLGFQQAGLRPVASVEINDFASRTHRNNFPGCRHFSGDIHGFDPTSWLEGCEVDSIQVVVGGPPCQGFSVAGHRDPNDERNRLFYEFIRVVDEVKPWYVVMENVPGILTMQKGVVQEAIKDAFAEIGYPDMSVAILESASYGVPQIRPRAIFVANRYGLPNPFPAPRLAPDQYVAIEAAIEDLPEYTTIPEINHEWTKHSTAYMERIAGVPPGGSLYATFADAFKRQYPGLPSMTVKENHGGTHIHPHLNRVISAREMARLQTFPDSFIFDGPMKKAMWQIGNAVPPLLASCIANALIPYLNQVLAIERGESRVNPGIDSMAYGKQLELRQSQILSNGET